MVAFASSPGRSSLKACSGVFAPGTITPSNNILPKAGAWHQPLTSLGASRAMWTQKRGPAKRRGGRQRCHGTHQCIKAGQRALSVQARHQHRRGDRGAPAAQAASRSRFASSGRHQRQKLRLHQGQELQLCCPLLQSVLISLGSKGSRFSSSNWSSTLS